MRESRLWNKRFSESGNQVCDVVTSVMKLKNRLFCRAASKQENQERIILSQKLDLQEMHVRQMEAERDAAKEALTATTARHLQEIDLSAEIEKAIVS